MDILNKINPYLFIYHAFLVKEETFFLYDAASFQAVTVNPQRCTVTFLGPADNESKQSSNVSRQFSKMNQSVTVCK